MDAIAVVIGSSGQLGTVSSSRRVKEDIRDLGAASARLKELRSVTSPFATARGDRQREALVRRPYCPEDRRRGSSAGLKYVRAKGPGPSIWIVASVVAIT